MGVEDREWFQEDRARRERLYGIGGTYGNGNNGGSVRRSSPQPSKKARKMRSPMTSSEKFFYYVGVIVVIAIASVLAGYAIRLGLDTAGLSWLNLDWIISQWNR